MKLGLHMFFRTRIANIYLSRAISVNDATFNSPNGCFEMVYGREGRDAFHCCLFHFALLGYWEELG